MWYVMQVRAGNEENIKLQCSKEISASLLQQCFLLYYEEKKRFQGSWKVLQKILFPGYLFVETEDLPGLCEALRPVIGLTKLIGTGREIVPLTQEEQTFLWEMGGPEHLVAMSEGVIENSCIRILSGPLKGREGLIRKIDRHKRKAWLEMELFGRLQQVEVGLEVIAKSVAAAPTAAEIGEMARELEEREEREKK